MAEPDPSPATTGDGDRPAANDRTADAAARPAATPARRRQGLLTITTWSLGGLIALLALALAGVWIWAGSEGSLATALRWAGAAQPIVTEEVSGNLRSSGKVRRLVWEQGGLRIEVHDAEIRWTPAALLTRTLQIDTLGASRILVDDQRPKGEPSTGPPESVALPIRLQVKELVAGELRWAGPPPYSMQDVAGRFDYDGQRHLLELDRARVEGGDYRARAAITAHAPLKLDLALAGALTAPLPGASSAVPLTLQATLHGPLTELRAQADLQAAPGQAGVPPLPALPSTPATAPVSATASAAPAAGADAELPQAHATARITPWAAQALPEAHARVRAFDLGAVWAEAPHTQLNGQFDLSPLPADGAPGWAVQANLDNRAPGPWDQRRLPVEHMVADVTWQGGVATVRALKAQLGGGSLESTGSWAAPPAASASGTNASASTPAPAAPPSGDAAGRWQIDTRITGVNPAQLHTRLAPFPVDGTAKVSGSGSAIDFDAELKARNQRDAASTRGGDTAAQALARDLRALRLRDLLASGRWHEGLLTLERLRVRSDDAELAGNARIRPAAPGGSADLAFDAPGARVLLKGEAQPASGAGTLRADISDVAALLAWARRLPGAEGALADIDASGRATLEGNWRGGWRDPSVQARLSVPSLDWHPADAGAETATIRARNLELTVGGQLAELQLAASGRVTQGKRELDLRLAASGGRSTPKATLAASRWSATVAQLEAGVRDPALGAGRWQLTSRQPVPLSWSPLKGGQFEAGAGELALTSPAPVSQAVIAWGPARWQAGELSTTGRITGLPLQWVERVAGTQLADAGLTGSVIFDGDWDATLGQRLRVSAKLARASGDLTILTTDPQTGVQSSVPAGLREARLTLDSEGEALNLQLRWDSAQAGTVDGQLRTELSAARDADGHTNWSWPASAPLQGQLQASLPQISAWSVLAPPGWRLRGSLAADTRIGGTRGEPRIDGTLSADDLALRSVVDGIQFADGRLRARLDGSRLLIDEFLLHGAGEQGGRLRASGEAGWIDGRAQARLTTTLQQLHASIRADRQVTVSGQVQTALEGRAIRADGQLRVDQALIVLPDQGTPSLGSDVIVRGADGKIMYGKQAPGAVARPTSAAGRQAAAQEQRAEARRTAASDKAERGESTPLTVAAKLQIELGDDFRVQGLGIDTRLAGTLNLAAAGPLTAMPVLNGTVRTVGGTFRAYGQMLRIERGHIVFKGDASNPTLDIIALRPNYTSDQRIGAQVMGTALLPRVRLYSDPALPDNQTLAWLLLGRPAPNTGAEAAMLQSAALALLGGREGRGLAASFGLDELSFTGGGDGEVANASVTLGKRLSDRLYAAYEHSLSGASGTLLIFYELSRRWTLRGQAGENAAVDLIYRLSFN